MPTRTWRGTTNNLWSVASNWLEGSVPVAGDDVVFDSSSGNCVLDVNTPNLRSFVATNFTGTINLSDYVLNIGSVTFTGTMFDAGTTCTWQCGNGKIRLGCYSGLYTSTNVCYMNNTSLSNVDFEIVLGSNNVLNIFSNFYARNVVDYSYCLYGAYSGPIRNFYIYGSFERLGNYSGLINLQSFRMVNLYLQGSGNLRGIFRLDNSYIYITGNYTLSGDMYVYSGFDDTGWRTINITGTLDTSNYILYVSNIKHVNLGVGLIVDIRTPIKNICLNATVGTIRLRNITVTNNLILMGGEEAFNFYIESGETGNATVTLANDGKYCINYAVLRNLNFSRPVVAYNSIINNCNNIINVEHPQIFKFVS